MAWYRLLTPHHQDGQLLPALSEVTRPAGFVPTLHMEPLDGEAIRAYWDAGPRPSTPPQRLATKPKIYWQPIPNVGGSIAFYQLTGAGAALGPKND